MTTTTPYNVEDIAHSVMIAVENSMKKSIHIWWDFLLSYLSQHWRSVILIIFAAILIATIKAMLGRWGSLGSLLYNLIYFGTLFIVGLIFGPEIFINNFFGAACSVALYPLCYKLVGLILDKTGLK